MFACLIERKIQFNLCAKNCLFERNVDVGFNIAAAGLSLATALSAAKKTTKNITEPQVPEVKVNILALSAKAAETLERVGTTVTTDTRVTELIVALAFG